MWFDARAKLAEIAGQPPATSATPATPATHAPPPAPAARPVSQVSQLSQAPEARKPAFRVATVASVATVATPPRPEPAPAPPARADGLDPDAGAYLDRLRADGPATYGAMAGALGWGATRAWQAEARLRAAGLLTFDNLGRAQPVKQGQAMTPRMLATVRPGPVLHLWQDGREVARLPLDMHAALTLAADLLCAARDARRGGMAGTSGGDVID